MPRSRRPAVTQTHLSMPVDGERGPWRCHGVFAPNYVSRQLTENADCPTAGELRELYDRIKQRWVQNYTGLCRQNEAYTRTRFLDPTLSDLGWFFIPENQLPQGNTRKRPDYCLFRNESTEQCVASQSASDIFRASETVLEAKRAEHSLDKVSENETPGWFPSQQIQDYLRWATDGTGERFFRWAVLSNGNEWRLYCSDAAPDAFFTFSLADGAEFCSIEDFRLFAWLFRPGAFERDGDGRCLLDSLHEQSLNQQLELEEKLRRRIFDVLEELAEGFFHNSENGLTESDLPAIYEASLIFLYRLLFILYAESRGLLPVKRHGPGANRRYLDEFSLARLIEKLRDSNAYADDAFDGLYLELVKLFNLIDGSKREQNEKLGVTRYNGRLFSKVAHPEIESWRVGEKTLANVLRQLMFAQPAARGRQKVIVTHDTIDYSTLEVRRLGDIYEGLLGGHLQLQPDGRLQLLNERGTNQRDGIFYTPDWIVAYLVRETLQPLLNRIDASADVQAALTAKSTERQKDNSFAHAVLRLNIVDPAMGSGHFLVRATEYLAQRIFDHSTSRRMTEQIVSHGKTPRSREQIRSDGRIPVSPGLSQEQAEIGYWRRRVVEACIYGVDTNSLAVELSKLSLWLTCIAVDEPLSFLDHHLRTGNSLLGAQPEELRRLPFLSPEEAKEGVFEIGDRLRETISKVIKENVDIESHASTEMEVVKSKERRWREVRGLLQPFLDVGNIWIAALDGLPIDHLSYRNAALAILDPESATVDQKADAVRVLAALQVRLDDKNKTLQPFHWQLEFPDVFYSADGRPLAAGERGFHAVLGNPPYVSTHTSAEQSWRRALKRRVEYVEDLYVHFTDVGLRLLNDSGAIGFIVSDTFFTLATKSRMRDLLQCNRLAILGQCDPFDATVDAAIFVAQKSKMEDSEQLVFIQARNSNDTSAPERELEQVKAPAEIEFGEDPDALGVRHGQQGCLRLHRVPIGVYREAVGRAFFEPSVQAMELYRRFNSRQIDLKEEWWERIESSDRFDENFSAIGEHQAKLEPGDVTLVGLIAAGAQGLATANNDRFLGYLERTPQAVKIEALRDVWTSNWTKNARIRAEFTKLIAEYGGDPQQPAHDVPAWESCVDTLKGKFDAKRDLGIKKTDLYRVIPRDLVATKEDFVFTWTKRKSELLALWQTERILDEFWSDAELIRGRRGSLRAVVRKSRDISDQVFCDLCQDLLAWWIAENRRRKDRKMPRIPRDSLRLNPSEHYADPADAPRIAVIYNGLAGRAQWVPFRKGDPEGNRWIDDEPLFINWSHDSVKYLSTAPKARWQGHAFFFQPGITWTRGANHVALKARLQQDCVFDVNALRLTPTDSRLFPANAFLSVVNSDVFSFFRKKFVANTWMAQINDLRMMPLVIPTDTQSRQLTALAESAIAVRRLTISGDPISNELAASIRLMSRDLLSSAPPYLRPPAQRLLLHTPADGLAIIESCVNWEAEKLYGVEGVGPFDEF